MIAKRKPRILLTNDDGISAAGIQALYKAVKGIGEVTIVAPDSERSESRDYFLVALVW